MPPSALDVDYQEHDTCTRDKACVCPNCKQTILYEDMLYSIDTMIFDNFMEQFRF